MKEIKEKSEMIRTSKEFKDVINFIRIEYIKEGKNPPKTATITKIIANEIDKKNILKKLKLY